MKCPKCGEPYNLGQKWCVKCRFSFEQKGYLIADDETCKVYSTNELVMLKNNGVINAATKLIRCPEGEIILAGAMFDFSVHAVTKADDNSSGGSNNSNIGLRVTAAMFIVLCPPIGIILSSIGAAISKSEEDKKVFSYYNIFGVIWAAAIIYWCCLTATISAI